jgi:hypothetical protein
LVLEDTMERWDRGDEPRAPRPREERGLHAPRGQSEPEPRRAPGPHNHRRTQTRDRWRRHEHTIPGVLLEEWELAAFYESFDGPRA